MKPKPLIASVILYAYPSAISLNYTVVDMRHYHPISVFCTCLEASILLDINEGGYYSKDREIFNMSAHLTNAHAHPLSISCFISHFQLFSFIHCQTVFFQHDHVPLKCLFTISLSSSPAVSESFHSLFPLFTWIPLFSVGLSGTVMKDRVCVCVCLCLCVCVCACVCVVSDYRGSVSSRSADCRLPPHSEKGRLSASPPDPTLHTTSSQSALSSTAARDNQREQRRR